MLNVVKRDLTEKEHIRELEKIKTKNFLYNVENKKK